MFFGRRFDSAHLHRSRKMPVQPRKVSAKITHHRELIVPRKRGRIFLVAVMKRDPNTGNTRQRTWGWYTNFADAEQAVLENHTDIFEANYYNLAVIEEMPEGVMACAKNVWWYQATYPDNHQGLVDPSVQRIDPPEWSLLQFNFTL